MQTAHVKCNLGPVDGAWHRRNRFFGGLYMADEGSLASQVANGAWVTFLALLGILARQAHSSAVDGKINWRLLGVACLTAPALGVIAGGLAAWAGVPQFANSAIVALVGFLGPAFVQATAGRLSDLWFKRAGG